MSSAEDLNTKKDEDTDKSFVSTSEVAIENSSQRVGNLEGVTRVIAETTSKIVLEYSNKESGDNVADISHVKAIMSTDTATKSLTSELDKGDNEHSATDVEVGKYDDINKNNDTTDEGKEAKNVDNDEVEDDDLELKWDDSDGYVQTPNDSAENADIGNETNNTKEIETINDIESQPDMVSKEKNIKQPEKNFELTLLEENVTIKDTEMILPLEATVETEESFVKLSAATSMEIDEEELLKDDSPQGMETMDVDLPDEESTITKAIEKIPDPIDDVTKIHEKSTEKDVDDKSNSHIEIEEHDNSKASNNDELNKNYGGTTSENIKINDSNLDLNLSMAIDTTEVSLGTSVQLKTNHKINKPDVMLEIPTQELIDVDDLLDSPNCSNVDDTANDEPIDKCIDNAIQINDDIDNAAKPAHTVEDIAMADQIASNAKTASNIEIDMIDKTEISFAEFEAKSQENINANSKNNETDKDLEKENPIDTSAPTIEEAQPSTSSSIVRMTPDTSDEVPETSDSLGLLAESCRVMGRDDEDEADDDEEGDVDDDDSDQDESSNQMTGDQSEDSNAPHSETDPTRCEQERETAEREDIETELKEGTEDDGEIDKCEEEFEYSIDDVDIDIEENMTFKIEEKLDEKGDKQPLLPKIKTAESQIHIKDEEGVIKATNTEGLEKDGAIQSNDTGKIEKDGSPPDVVISPIQSNDTGEIEKDSTTPREIAIKKEKDDAIVAKRVTEKKKAIIDKAADDEFPISGRSSVSSNDDVIEQPFEIEIVKLSDDEDDEPAKPEDVPAKADIPVQEDQIQIDATGVTMSPKKTASPEVAASPEKIASPKVAASPEKRASPEPVISGDAAIPENKTKDDISTDEVKTSEEPQSTSDPNKVSPKTSPSKLKNLSMSTVVNTTVLNIVELGESSSEDDILEVEKVPEHTLSQLQKLLEAPLSPKPPKDVTTVNIPTGIEIMSTSGEGGNRSEIVTKEGEVVISGVSKPPPHKPARLNTSEVTIKTASSSEQTLVIPETKVNEPSQPTAPSKPRLSLEIFSLDSDEEETPTKEPEKPIKKLKKCINNSCPSGQVPLCPADASTAAYYDNRKKRPLVCQKCADAVVERQQKLIAGIKNLTPLLQLEIPSAAQDLVEILDSESEDEDTPQDHLPKDTIGEETAKFLEENLADLLNDTWKKHNLDARLKETKDELNAEILKMEQESQEINQMLEDCQRVTDKLRNDLYATFQHRIQELPPLLIHDTPDFHYMGPDTENTAPIVVSESRLNAKRKMLIINEQPAKRPAIPLGYAPLDDSKSKAQEEKPVDTKMNDDDKDISVVKLSAESAPDGLPAPGELSRPPLRVGMPVYAMKNAFGPWLKGRILEIMPKTANPSTFTSCRVKFDHKEKQNGKVLPARCIAYAEPSTARMTIGTRLIALFKDINRASKAEYYYSGVVAEIPNPVNKYRYLVFFDDGYAQYVQHPFTRLVCECSQLVWEEVHPFSREFVREYLMAYPERPMVRLHQGQHFKTEWNGKWWPSRVAKVDASLAQVVFIGDGRREWIYRGSTRLAPLYLELRAAERHRPRPMPRAIPRSKPPVASRTDVMPYVEYTRSDEPAAKAQDTQPGQPNEEFRQLRAVAKKSTTGPAHYPPVPSSHSPGPTPYSFTSRVVYYTPKNAVRPYKLTPHKCSPKCKRTDVLSLKDLRTYNPLAKPLLSGWERQIVRFKGQKEVMYRAPCGRRVRNMRELHHYLRVTDSDLPVDLFDFYPATHCLAEFVLSKCLVGKKDLSHGKENVPVPCVNYYDDSLPEFCSYNTERTPTSGVPLNLDPEFLCGCDCTDDCEDKTKCACWKMTLEGARTIGLEGANVGYEYKRLPEPLPSGIYECNSRCKCKNTCLNRVAQHPLQLKLQVFKTLKRGWGIRALNDVPKGAFLCVYAGNLLTDATANLDGLNEGDEYLAELDYIEVVEQMKEGYEEDIPDVDKKLDKDGVKQEDSEEESSPSEEDEPTSKNDKEDDDFRPGFVMGPSVSEFNKRLRRRKKKEQDDKENAEKEKDNVDKEQKPSNPDEDCITISDDDEVREPSSFSAKPGMVGNDFISKYRSVRTLFGEDEACYIMDAKVQGNIGRYLNHSCSPNVFVQNVFVDTHDPRFPWVAFFALSHIKAGTELTWNYNYDVGSVPGKILYCYCDAPNCRGRLL